VQSGPITLDPSGLTISSISLTLSAAFGGSTLSANNITVGADGTVGTSVKLGEIQFMLGGNSGPLAFAADASGVTLSRQGISADTITVTVPSALVPADVGNTLVGHGIYLDSDGSFGGNVSLPDTSVNVGGFAVSIFGLSLSTHGISVITAMLGITPPSGAPFTIIGSNIALGFDGSLQGTLSAKRGQPGPLVRRLHAAHRRHHPGPPARAVGQRRATGLPVLDLPLWLDRAGAARLADHRPELQRQRHAHHRPHLAHDGGLHPS